MASRANLSWDARLRDGATRCSWQPSCRCGGSKRRATGSVSSTSSWSGWEPTESISTCCTAWRPSPGTRSRICAAWLLWNVPRLTAASGTSAFRFMAHLTTSAPSSTRSTGNSASSSSTTWTSSTRLACKACATPKAAGWAWWSWRPCAAGPWPGCRPRWRASGRARRGPGRRQNGLCAGCGIYRAW